MSNTDGKVFNCRIVEVGRGLWRSSGPIPLLKQGHLEPLAQDFVTNVTNRKAAYKCFTLIPWELVLCLENYVGPLFSFSHLFSSYFDIKAAIRIIFCRITKWNFCWRAARKFIFSPKYQFNSLRSITLLSAFLLFSKSSLAPQINFQWWPSNKNVKMQWNENILKSPRTYDQNPCDTHFCFHSNFSFFFQYCNQFIFIMSSIDFNSEYFPHLMPFLSY